MNVSASVSASSTGRRHMAVHPSAALTNALTDSLTLGEEKKMYKTPMNTHISLFSLPSVSNVGTGSARGPFSARNSRFSVSAPRAREDADTKKDNPGQGKGRQSNSAVEPIRSCRRTIYPIGPAMSTGQRRKSADFRYLAGRRGDKGLSAGGSSPAPSRRQGAGRSAANKETLFLSGKSRKGKRHG